MALKFFTIPINAFKESEQHLNLFLSQHRVASIEKQFVADGNNSFWSVCVTTAFSEALKPHGNKRKPKTIDYKEVLSHEDFSVFSELRTLRKQISDAEGIPAYAVFTNEQLARMVTNNVQSKADLLAIEGIGQARIEKYAEHFLAGLKSQQ